MDKLETKGENALTLFRSPVFLLVVMVVSVSTIIVVDLFCAPTSRLTLSDAIFATLIHHPRAFLVTVILCLALLCLRLAFELFRRTEQDEGDPYDRLHAEVLRIVESDSKLYPLTVQGKMKKLVQIERIRKRALSQVSQSEYLCQTINSFVDEQCLVVLGQELLRESHITWIAAAEKATPFLFWGRKTEQAVLKLMRRFEYDRFFKREWTPQQLKNEIRLLEKDRNYLIKNIGKSGVERAIEKELIDSPIDIRHKLEYAQEMFQDKGHIEYLDSDPKDAKALFRMKREHRQSLGNELNVAGNISRSHRDLHPGSVDDLNDTLVKTHLRGRIAEEERKIGNSSIQENAEELSHLHEEITALKKKHKNVSGDIEDMYRRKRNETKERK